MELLGAREGGRSGKCKSKAARAKLLAFSEQLLINCSLQRLVEIKSTVISKAHLLAWWLALQEAHTSANEQSAIPLHTGQCLWVYSTAILVLLYLYSQWNNITKQNLIPIPQVPPSGYWSNLCDSQQQLWRTAWREIPRNALQSGNRCGTLTHGTVRRDALLTCE